MFSNAYLIRKHRSLGFKRLVPLESNFEWEIKGWALPFIKLVSYVKTCMAYDEKYIFTWNET